MRSNWNAFWSDKTTPKWAESSEEYYRRYASELQLLYQGRSLSRVLELGCGSGSLYPHLGLEYATYKGVDFSKTMLATFQSQHPTLELVQSAAETYGDASTYELILSNGLIQYFDRSMLDQHLANARDMMSSDSLLLCGSVPWRARRLGYCRRAFASDNPRSLVRGMLMLGKYILAGDPVGHWYTLTDFRVLAKRHGMRVAFHGSAVHLYRFHACLTRLA